VRLEVLAALCRPVLRRKDPFGQELLNRRHWTRTGESHAYEDGAVTPNFPSLSVIRSQRSPSLGRQFFGKRVNQRGIDITA
jgi:hypothetical protein